MFSNPQKLAQEMMKPVIELAANNTAFAVKMIGRNAEAATKQLEGNLAHLKALATVEDVNGVVQLQKDYLKSATEDLQSEAAANAKIAQEAVMDFNKVAQDSWAEVKSQIQESVQAAK